MRMARPLEERQDAIIHTWVLSSFEKEGGRDEREERERMRKKEGRTRSALFKTSTQPPEVGE